MAKEKDLERLLAGLRRCSGELSEIAGTLADLLSGEKPAEAQGNPAERTEKTYTFEDVRALLAEKARAGGREEVKALLKRFGAVRLSDVAPADYGALATAAEMIDNG